MSISSRDNLQQYVGYAVRKRRNHLGLSQENLAAKANLHRTYIADIERGKRNPSLNSLAAIAAALEFKLSDLLRLAERG